MTPKQHQRRAIERLLAQNELCQASGLTQEAPLRFGDVAVILGFVTREQVDGALALQEMAREEGRPHELLGEILTSQRHLSCERRDTVVDVLAELARVQRERPTANGNLNWDLLIDRYGRCA